MAEPDELNVRSGDVERYEALRAQALGGEAGGWRHGLALLEGRGTAAWLRACRSVPAAGDFLSEPPAVTAAAGGDLVGVLAAMALAVLG